MNIETVELKSGAHKSAAEGMCLLEAASFIAGEPFSDKPQCVCSGIASLGRSLNDRIPYDDMRTELLRPLLPKLIGTAGSPELRRRRAFAAADAAVRIFAPMAFDSAKKPELATRLRMVPQIVDKATALAGRDVAQTVRKDADAAYAAADAAAYAAADAAAYAADAADAADAAAADADRKAARRPGYEACVKLILELCEMKDEVAAA